MQSVVFKKANLRSFNFNNVFGRVRLATIFDRVTLLKKIEIQNDFVLSSIDDSYELFNPLSLKKKRNKCFLDISFFNMFDKKTLLSLKNSSFNPLFLEGGNARGFGKLLKAVGFDETNSRFLRPRWYRINKMQIFKAQISSMTLKFGLYKPFFLASFRRNSIVLLNKGDFVFLYQFFIKKRWFLLDILFRKVINE